MSTERLCNPDCCDPDGPHVDAVVGWIGDFPLTHGERDEMNGDPLPHDVPGTSYRVGGFVVAGDTYCLCGHPNYLTCPGAFGEGSVLGVTIERSSE
jgi:hypothetical protein